MRTAHALAAFILAVTATLAPAPASASCAQTPPPAKAVFTGTVTATDHDGRRATVNTDDGRVVTMVGTADLGAAATSVDRTYEVGGRYEFHTLNDASPYEDNACTATKKIGAASVDGAARPSTATSIGAGTGLAVALAIAALIWYRKRKGNPT